MVIDYSIKSTRYRIVNLQNRIVYNDTISTPQQAFTVTIGVIGNISEILQAGSTLEYTDEVYLDDLPCEADRESVIRKIIGAELFTSSYLKFNVNDVINNQSKKVYSGPLYRTYNGELDDAYEMYQKTLSSEITGFSLVNSNNVLTSEEFAAVMPSFNIQADKSDGCMVDFVEKVDEVIDELGIELSLNETLKKMRTVAYLYRQPEEIIATVTLGMTLDKEWFFCGEDFFPYESIKNAEYTTYMDNEVVSMSRKMDDGFRAIYDKKKFLDSNDWGDDYKQYMHDAFMALLVGSIKTSTIYDNPGLKYIVDHLLDSSKKLSESYEEMIMHARTSVFSKNVESVKNTMLMPNIFEQLIADEKIGYRGYVGDDDVHYFGKLKKEYKINYADLNTSDAYDSAYEIGHTVDTMMNVEAMETGANLYKEYGKFMFGVNIGAWTNIDSIGIDKRLNYVIDGTKYGFAVVMQKNGEDVFAIAYDYKTKELKINNISNLDIVSYPLLLASFDILLHDYYDTLEGYKRVGLGIYDYYSSTLPEGTMSKQFLLMNNDAKFYPDRIVLGVTVGAFDSQVRLSRGDSVQTEVVCYAGPNDPYKVSVGMDDNVLTISGDGIETIHYSMETLSNHPSERIVDNGVYIQMYRVDRLLPSKYTNSSLTRANVSVLGSSRESENGIEGEFRVVDFTELKEITLSENRKIYLALGGNGLIAWLKTQKYSTDPIELVSIDDIMSNKHSEMNIEFFGISTTIVFE
jgi:hypothetical protein